MGHCHTAATSVALNCCLNPSDARPDSVSMIDREDHKRQASSRQVLLILNVPIHSKLRIEASGFGRGNQISVFQLMPSALPREDNFMVGKMDSEASQSALVKPDGHQAPELSRTQ